MANRIKISEVKKFKETEGKKNFSSIVLLRSNQLRTAKNGSEFLMLEFGDNSGTIGAMCFDGSPAFQILKDAQPATALEIDAVSDFYQGRLSPKIESARRLGDEELEQALADLAPVSPFDPQAMRSELCGIIADISDESLRATILYAINEVGEAYFTSTAATKMHHAYVHGLLEHSLKTARMANALLPLYPYIDRDLALAGCILHDIGKVEEYSQTLVPERTRAGILHGHVVLGYRIVRKAGLKNGLSPDLQERLEHIILSHQGELEWGAAARAATPEAVFVSSIDNFDAKMGAIEAALASAQGSEFVEVGALRAKILTAPVVREK